MKKMICVIVTIISMTPFSSNSQNNTLQKNYHGSFIVVPIEAPVIKTNAINSALIEKALPPIKTPSILFGIGIQLYSSNVITLISYSKNTSIYYQENFETRLSYKSIGINIGYNLLRSPSISLYPYVGLKRIILDYQSNQEQQTEVSFENYLQSKHTYHSLSTAKNCIDLGLGLSKQKIFLINLKAGCLLLNETKSWETNHKEVKIIDAPLIRFNYYIQLTLGLGNLLNENELQRLRKKEKKEPVYSL
jgi:hypothetical protein